MKVTFSVLPTPSVRGLVSSGGEQVWENYFPNPMYWSGNPEDMHRHSKWHSVEENSNMENGNSSFSHSVGIYNVKKKMAKIKMQSRKFWEGVFTAHGVKYNSGRD